MSKKDIHGKGSPVTKAGSTEYTKGARRKEEGGRIVAGSWGCSLR